ncbi:MAG: hypothetical protein CMJ77_13935 [Planctomycetaceae bacterium]|nr:hypothetical protein [Planctomycetaceae bacterium]
MGFVEGMLSPLITGQQPALPQPLMGAFTQPVEHQRVAPEMNRGHCWFFETFYIARVNARRQGCDDHRCVMLLK